MQRNEATRLRLRAALGVSLALAACGEGDDRSLSDTLLSAPKPDPLAARLPPGGGVDRTPLARPNRTQSGMREAPELFATSGEVVWDGKPTLEGLWLAHPEAASAQRVRVRNPATGTVIDGALLPRRTGARETGMLISAEAADALGLLPGVRAAIELVAIQPEAPPLDYAAAAADALEARGEATAGEPPESGADTSPEAATAVADAVPAADAPAPAAASPTAGLAPEVAREKTPAPPANTPDPLPAIAEKPDAGRVAGAPPASAATTTANTAATAASPAGRSPSAETRAPIPDYVPAVVAESRRSAAAAAPAADAEADTAPQGGAARPSATPPPSSDSPPASAAAAGRTAPAQALVAEAAPPARSNSPAATAAPAPAAAAAVPAADRASNGTDGAAEASAAAPSPRQAGRPAAAAITDGKPYIQAGYFAVPEHAADLVRTLSSYGIPARNQAETVRGTALNRVVAGPFVSSEARERAIRQLRAIGITDARPTSG